MSAHFPQLHAPRWLRERLHEGRVQRTGHRARGGRSVSVLPVALVAAFSVGAWLAQVGDVAASGAPLGMRMLAGIAMPAEGSVAARVADDADAAGVLGDMPSASVDAITL
jgi:hypothetical protein